MIDHVNMDNHKKPDGHIDWTSYEKAKVANGEKCRTCGQYLIFASGYPDECEHCKVVHRSNFAVEHSYLIRCPHCRHEMNVYNDELFDLYDAGYHEVSCTLCDKEFEVETRITYSFESPDIIEDEDKEDDAGTDDEERDSAT
jgi:hypothetical protein